MTKISSLVFVVGRVIQSFIPNIFQSVMQLASRLDGLWVSVHSFPPEFEKPKGQLISKHPFSVIVWTKVPTIFLRISALASKKWSNEIALFIPLHNWRILF